MEIDKLTNRGMGSFFKPLYLRSHSSVQTALDDGQLSNDSELIVSTIGMQQVAFSKHRMGFHHIAQGHLDDTDYLVTFCVICNSGMAFNSVVGDEVLHFSVAGVYNGMLLMIDKKTGSYWDHITGECISGQYKGICLDTLRSHQILTTQETLVQYPACKYGSERLSFLQRFFAAFSTWTSGTDGKGFLPPGFRKSMIPTDKRLPEMEMGLGIWTTKVAKFYPLSLINENGKLLFDLFNGRKLLIYISSASASPSAMYIDDVNAASIVESKIVLSNGDYIEADNLYSMENVKKDFGKPYHLFLRWFGFAATFPNCEVAVGAEFENVSKR